MLACSRSRCGHSGRFAAAFVDACWTHHEFRCRPSSPPEGVRGGKRVTALSERRKGPEDAPRTRVTSKYRAVWNWHEDRGRLVPQAAPRSARCTGSMDSEDPRSFLPPASTASPGCGCTPVLLLRLGNDHTMSSTITREVCMCTRDVGWYGHSYSLPPARLQWPPPR